MHVFLSTGNEIVGEDLNHARPHSAKMRQIEERLKTLEEKLKDLHESLTEKDRIKAMEARVQEIETTVKQLKESIENGVEETAYFEKTHDQIEESLKENYELSEKDQKLVRKSSEQEEMVVVVDSTPNVYVSFQGKFVVYVFLVTISLDVADILVKSKCL